MKPVTYWALALSSLVSACGGGSGTELQDAGEGSNRAPQIDPLIGTFTVTENTTEVATISASDPDGDTITFAVSGIDAQSFEISEDGVLTFLTAPDFEAPADSDGDNLYQVTIVVSDGTDSGSVGLLAQVENDENDDFQLKASGFTAGTAIPLIHACANLGGNNYSPQLSWQNAPAGTSSFALVVDDETAPCGTDANACVHWNLFNINGSIDALAEDLDPSTLVDVSGFSSAVEGLTYAGTNDYEGPCPPPGNAHTYTFTLYALNANQPTLTRLDALTRSEFEEAYAANVVAQATLTGTFTQ
ncbi:MAG: YbhB/YbcL family Raf kinase inhibitor-like protein [Gammaproteobacteria bacterium]|jgi:Raf kinase inhibitor-like YbhB/YbcL family protein